MAKRLDSFLVVDCLIMECDLVHEWVACGGNMIVVLFYLRYKDKIGNL